MCADPVSLPSDSDVETLRARIRELEAENARFRQLGLSDIAYSCVMSQHGVYSIDWLSGAVEKITGYTSEELLAMKCWGTIVEEDDLHIFEKSIKNLVLGETTHCELRIRRKDGEIRWLSSNAECVAEENGKRIYGGLVDVTARKNIEEATQKAEARYHALFEQSHDAVFILSLEGVHLDANRRASELLGYTREELLSLSVVDTSAEQAQSMNVIERLLNGEHVPLYERRFRRKNGEIIFTEVNVEVVRDSNGNPLHIQSVVRDITERK